MIMLVVVKTVMMTTTMTVVVEATIMSVNILRYFEMHSMSYF